ncbi:MAG TPA: SurA N-terminal domain-containing protein [Solirubrobacteraceae bacterium]|jgi:hypothetical protein|nr:SurA N-terminal domain-containing protein [Solirubrobacteraceae bacterium]
MGRKPSRIAIAAALFAALGIGACGGSGSGQVVARVGDQTITMGKLDHLVAVLKSGWAATEQGGGNVSALRTRALGSLISSQWLIGEAADRGLSSSGLEVRRQIDLIEHRTFLGGVAELREVLQKSTGQTVADLELQASAELAQAKLRQLALAGVPKVSRAEVAAYYAQHKQSYFIRGRREARFQNRKTRAKIEKVKREVEAGKSLTSPDQVEAGELYAGAHVPPGRGDPYEAAIDSAKPHTLAGPFKIHNDEWLYEVVKVVAPRQQSLAQVAGAIAHKLTEERTQAALAGFVKTLTAEWTARTDCAGGYVAPGCRQYRGGATAGLVRL